MPPLPTSTPRTTAPPSTTSDCEDVDRDRIGFQAICGLSGMALTAAAADTCIKAVATCSMYDMSRSMSSGHQDFYTPEQRLEIVDYPSRQRWIDVENGTFGRGFHEVPFDEDRSWSSRRT